MDCTGCGVILVAAGEGRRFGRAKAGVLLDGVPLVTLAAAMFDGFPDRVVVLRPEDAALAPAGWKLAHGGPRRRDSVANGLAALDPSTRFVLVHDAARPLCPRAVVSRVLAAARTCGAAVPVVPLADTVKEVRDGRVVRTPPRDALRAAQTPQAFSRALLERALASPDRGETDESALVEGLGEPVAAVEGAPENLKITIPRDLDLASRLRRPF